MNFDEIRQEDTLGGRIVYARTAIGLTVPQLARRLGIRAETLANWESDRSEPRSNRLQILAGVLGVSLGWLLAGSGEPPRPNESEPETDDVSAELGRIRADAARLLERIDMLGEQLQRSGGRQH